MVSHKHHEVSEKKSWNNVISHFAYSIARYPALSTNEQFAYDWIIKDWQVKSCQQT